MFWKWWRRFRTDAFGALPDRVQQLVDAEQRSSEVLVAWIQLAIVLFFGVLYGLSPKSFDAMARFEPVPWIVAAFLLLGLARLGLAHRARPHPALDMAATFIDFGLLYALIWSFHIQYRQPPAFYLKAPTFIYVFIFLALRALRFNPRDVIAAGLIAAAGWAAMASYAFAVTGEDAVTRDFVTYAMSNRLLVGAEVDRIAAILAVTLILTLAIARARRQLIAAAVGAAARDDLSRFFAPGLADQITATDAPPEAGLGTLKPAAILVVDLRSFTRLAMSLAPHQTMALLTDYQRRVGEVIARHNGAIDKFLGDGILATFGCVRSSVVETADALRAADGVLAEAQLWFAERRARGAEPLQVGLAVAAGPVVFGTVGEASRLEVTVIGDAVNLATKLEGHNKVVGSLALTDRMTYERALAQGYEGPERPILRDRAVAGLETPLDLVVLASGPMAVPMAPPRL